MDNKVIALIMSLVMVFAGVTVLIDGINANETPNTVSDTDTIQETDDTPNPTISAVEKGTVYVKVNHTTTVNFVITEPDDNYFDSEVTWSYDSNGSIKEKETEIATISVSGNSGHYTATITGKAAGTVSNYKLTYTINTNIDSEHIDNETADNECVSQSIDYLINVEVLSDPLPAQNAGIFGLDDKVTIQYGKPIDRTQISGYDDDYIYYAMHLPAGVQMTPDGYISGTPVSDDMDIDGKYNNVIVVATHIASNQTFTQTYTMIVSSASSDAFSFKVVGDDIKTVVDGQRYIAISGEDFYIHTYKGESHDDTDHSDDVNITKVYTIAEDGTQTKVDGSDGVYKLDSYGSGEFTVVMVNGDEVEHFQVVIVALSADVHTGIGFAPNTSINNNSNENESVVSS